MFGITYTMLIISSSTNAMTKHYQINQHGGCQAQSAQNYGSSADNWMSPLDFCPAKHLAATKGGLFSGYSGLNTTISGS
jgi:ribonuclease I